MISSESRPERDDRVLPGGPETWLEKTITTAQGQAALLYELRATVQLAKLLARQGRRAEASRRLGQTYSSFTEGHQTPLLQTAESLLAQLRA
jgi:hypothetical protein